MKTNLQATVATVVLWMAATSSVCCFAQPAAVEDDTAGEIRVFDGGPKLLIVHGYSTSQHWWAFLQRKIDRYGGGADNRVVQVRLCNKGGTPIARWMDVDSGERTEAWKRMLTPMIQAERGKRPVLVLAQQSLQFVYPGQRSAGIRGPDDAERIKVGADTIERYAQRILEDGAAGVMIGMHIFKHNMEPAIGNERLALAELVNREPTRIYAGPDTWQPTKENFPLAFDNDQLHPNFIGAEIMAHYWFDALLKREGLKTPAWSQQEMDDAIERRPMGTVRDRERFLAKLRQWKIDVPEPPTPDRSRRRIPPAVLKRYDTDGDGRLNDDERKAFERARRERFGS